MRYDRVMQLKMRFLGAAGEVTGSGYLLEYGDEKVVVDLGMFQGEGEKAKNDRPLVFDPRTVTGMILTHAHLDHCGRVPLMLKGGFEGKIWTTEATRELTELVLHDSAKIAMSNAKAEGGWPIYSDIEVMETVAAMTTVAYGSQFKIGNHFEAKLLDAGHILGSASVELKVVEAGRVLKTLVFSGDLGNEPSPIVDLIQVPKTGQIVIMESTYGNRLHEPRGVEREKLKTLCEKTQRRNACLLIPAFSLEKTQELLYLFHQMKKSGEIAPDLPVWLDAPMGIRATAIFERFVELFNDKIRAEYQEESVFEFPGLVIMMKSASSRHRRVKQRFGDEGGKVVIAGSGMMEGGRILGHAITELPKKSTVLLLTGFQAEGTLGREISTGAKEVYINDKRVVVRAEIDEITSMSAHADKNGLMKWLRQIMAVEEVIITHGEAEQRDSLEQEIIRLGIKKTHKPMYGEELVWQV